jgi:hypothetical protein
MSNVIKLKRSETSNASPTSSDLEVGEVCMNIEDQKLYTKKSDNSIVVISETMTGKPELGLISTDTSSNAGPGIDLFRNSFSPFDSDEIGKIDFTGENDNSDKKTFVKIVSKINDASNTTETGELEIHIMNSGTVENIVTIKSNGIHLSTGKGIHFADGTSLTTTTGLGGDIPTHSHTMLSVDGTVGITSTTSGAGPTTSIAKIIALG